MKNARSDDSLRAGLVLPWTGHCFPRKLCHTPRGRRCDARARGRAQLKDQLIVLLAIWERLLSRPWLSKAVTPKYQVPVDRPSTT